MGDCCSREGATKPATSIHDQPIVGHFTAFFADSLGDAFGLGVMTDEEIKVAYDRIDTDKNGTLDRTEITVALRHLGKSERAIQKVMDGMEEDTLSLSEFTAIIRGTAQPYITNVGVGAYTVPLPNLKKIHDVPVLGAFTGATESLITGLAWSFMGTAFGAAFGGLSDNQLKEKFDEIDTDKSGKLDAKEIAVALRGLRVNEADIKKITDSVGKKELDFDAFKALVKPVAAPSVHDTPVVGHFTAFFADSFGGAFGFGAMTDAEIDAAFKKIDKDKSGTLDKTEIADALREMGKPERSIQELVDGMEEDTLDATEFKALVQGKAQPYITNVGIGDFEVPMPNLAKVHDIPILGAFTGATQKLVTGMTFSLMGVAFSAAFGSMTDEQLREQFEEIDKDKSGKLSAKEIAVALRNLHMNEADIKQITLKVGKEEIDFEGFKNLVR